MDLRQVKLLRMMIRLGSVSETARELNVSQPAVSQTLTAIQAELGLSLFTRENGRLNPTALALALLPELERIITDVSSLHETVQTMRDGKSGFIRLAAVTTLANTLVPTIMARFKQRHPEVRFSLMAGTTRETIDRVACNQADVGFAQQAVGDVAVHIPNLCRGSVVCVMPRGHRLSFLKRVTATDLLDEDIISFSPTTPTGARIRDAFRRFDVEPRIAIETNQASVACSLVSVGQGVALIDSFLSTRQLYANITYRPFWPDIGLPVQVLTSSRRQLSPFSAAFCDALTKFASPLESPDALWVGSSVGG